MPLICEIIYIQRYLKFILTIDTANRWGNNGYKLADDCIFENSFNSKFDGIHSKKALNTRVFCSEFGTKQYFAALFKPVS